MHQDNMEDKIYNVVVRSRASIPESLLTLVMEFKKEHKLRDRLTAFWILAKDGLKLWETSSKIQEIFINTFKNNFYDEKCRKVDFPCDELTKSIEFKVEQNKQIVELLDDFIYHHHPYISNSICVITLCGLYYWQQYGIEEKANVFSYKGFKFNLSQFNYEKFQDSLSIIDLTIKNQDKLLKAYDEMEKSMIDSAIKHFKKLGIRYLYKYKAVNSYFDSLIENSQIWFSKPTELNDLYECNPIIDKNAIDESKIVEIRENTSLTCFSKVNNDVLLWAHYADSNKGICLEFDIYKDPLFFLEILPITYVDSIPSISAKDMNENSDLSKKLFLTKTRDWSYEQEFRLIHYKNETIMKAFNMENKTFSFKLENKNSAKRNSITFNKQALASIIFGYKTSKRDRRHIISMIKKNNFKHTLFKNCILSHETSCLKIKLEQDV